MATTTTRAALAGLLLAGVALTASGCASDATYEYPEVTHEEMCEMRNGDDYFVTVGSKSKTTYRVSCDDVEAG